MTATPKQSGLTPGNSLHLINWLSDIFLNFDGLLPIEKIDSNINIALSVISEHFSIDRAAVFRFYQSNKNLSLTHEWIDFESKMQIRKKSARYKENLVKDVLPWLAGQIDKTPGGVPLALPFDKSTEKDREFLRPGPAESIIIVPMIYSKIFIGFLLFESLTENKELQENTDLINIITNIFINLFCNILS